MMHVESVTYFMKVDFNAAFACGMDSFSLLKILPTTNLSEGVINPSLTVLRASIEAYDPSWHTIYFNEPSLY